MLVTTQLTHTYKETNTNKLRHEVMWPHREHLTRGNVSRRSQPSCCRIYCWHWFHHFTIKRPRPGAPRKISDTAARRIIRRVEDHLWRASERAGIKQVQWFQRKQQVMHCASSWPVCKTPLLKKKHVEARSLLGPRLEDRTHQQ